jgi:Aspartyl protease
MDCSRIANDMKIATLVAFVLSALSLLALPQGPSDKPEAASRGKTLSHQGFFPIQVYDNLIFLQVRVNGAGPRSFILDSGASTCLLDESFADSIGLHPEHEHQKSIGAGESSNKLGFVKDVALRLPDIDLPRHACAVTPLNDIESAIGHNVDALLAQIFSSAML